MTALLWIALFAGAGWIAISLTPHWKYTVISNEYQGCTRRVANRRKAGMLIESMSLSKRCMAELDRKLAEAFGTTDIC